MISFRSLAMLLTAVSFALTTVISGWQHGLWHRGSVSAPPESIYVAPSPSEPSDALSVTAHDAAAPPAPVRTAMVSRAPSSQASVETARPAPSDAPPPQPIPVRLVFRSQGRNVGAELLSTSDQPLDISVVADNPVNGHESSIRLTVAASSAVDLVASGLSVEHGDNVTISSANYSDRQMHAN